jgi:hypothetical protein
LEQRLTPVASISEIENGFRLTIPPGQGKSYRLAQLDDYAKLSRKEFPHRPSLGLSLRESVPPACPAKRDLVFPRLAGKSSFVF